MEHIMQVKTIQSIIAIVAQGQAIHARYTAAIEAARIECKGQTREQVSDDLTPHIAASYAMPNYIKGQRGHTFDKTHPAYEAARKMRQRILADLFPVAAREQAEVTVDEDTIAAIQRVLAKAGLNKAEAKSACASAIARAFA